MPSGNNAVYNVVVNNLDSRFMADTECYAATTLGELLE
ncbi:uncharacterized protein METZ01_LOCUS504222, partial [marine metagenome]